jgi:Domain of unknown function (DUF222)
VVDDEDRLWTFTDEDLLALSETDRVAAARRESGRLALIRELDSRGAAQEWAATSTGALLSHRLLIDPSVAAADVRAARRLDPAGDVPPGPGTPTKTKVDLPLAATGRDLASGVISRPHAHVITSLVRSLPEPATGDTTTDRVRRQDLHARAQEFPLGHARQFCPADLRRLGRHLRHVLDPDGTLGQERAAERGAAFWTRPDRDGPGLRFAGITDAVTGDQLKEFIQAHAGPRPDTDPHTGPTTPGPAPRRPTPGRGLRAPGPHRNRSRPHHRRGVGTQPIITITLESGVPPPAGDPGPPR